jgi:hypothetical protein
MKKVIDFEVSYYQQRSITVARALIKHALINVIVNPLPLPPL